MKREARKMTPRQKAMKLRAILADIEADLASGPRPRVVNYDRGNRSNESEKYFEWRRGDFYRTKLAFRDYVLRALCHYESLVVD
jgi:hypothetical protein